MSFTPTLASTAGSLSQVLATPADLPVKLITIKNNSNDVVYPIFSTANSTLDETRGQVIRFDMNTPGSYASTPSVTITGAGPNAGGATADAVLGGPDGKSVVMLRLTNPGHDYTQIPTVTIANGTGGATATAVISQVPTAILKGGITADQTTL